MKEDINSAMFFALLELVEEFDTKNENDDHRTGYTLDTYGIQLAREIIAKVDKVLA